MQLSQVKFPSKFSQHTPLPPPFSLLLSQHTLQGEVHALLSTHSREALAVECLPVLPTDSLHVLVQTLS